MAFEIKKRNRETSHSLLRRFSKRIRQSGILLQVRRSRFRKRPLSQKAKRRAALRKEELRKKYKKLEKLGKIKRR